MCLPGGKLTTCILCLVEASMSLVSGPGRGGTAGKERPDALRLQVEQHVRYIQSLDTVCSIRLVRTEPLVMLTR